MSSTGGRNRKRSNVKRTATRRPSAADLTESTTEEPPTAAGPESEPGIDSAAGVADEGTKKASGSTAITAPETDETTIADDERPSAGTARTDGADTDETVEDDHSLDEKAEKPGKVTKQRGRGRKDAEEGEDAPVKELSERARRREAKKAMRMGNPAWFVPVMLGLFLLGLVWIVVFYLSQMMYPIPDIQYWNLAIGFGLLMLGFAMTTRWK